MVMNKRVNRTRITLEPDPSRVVFRPFVLSDRERVIKVLARVGSLSDAEADRQYERMMKAFDGRHPRLEPKFLKRYDSVAHLMISDRPVSPRRKVLIGAYFTQEYALEAAALFNPSIVPHPDQSGVAEGGLRFVLSLRATGEGHISSITFRTGTLTADCAIRVDEPAELISSGTVVDNPRYERPMFLRKMHELGLDTPFTSEILEGLTYNFSWRDLESAVHRSLARNKHLGGSDRQSADDVLALARANYEVSFEAETDISGRVIFPHSPTEMRGIEDARFVAFDYEDGARKYYATYTAVDSRAFLPQLIETDDFLDFRVSTLNGAEVQNKGMALFPRKVNGHYMMVSRQDNENLFLMSSDLLHFWEKKRLLMRPTYPWEYIQIGNCGSPIETPEGWLLLTHGVGYMRQYAIGAALLDLENPSKVIGRLSQPLLTPNEREREGYVPNVVYSCGGLIHHNRLVLPYALSDQCTSFATYEMDELLRELKRNGNVSGSRLEDLQADPQPQPSPS